MRMQKQISILLALVLLIGTIFSLPVSARPAEGVVTEIVGNVRVQVLSPTLVRIEVKGAQGFEDRTTFHIVNRTDWEGAAVTRTQNASLTCIATANYQVYLPNDATSLTGVYVTDRHGVQLWKYASLPSASVYLPSPGDPADVWAIADNPRIVPAEWGYNVAGEGAAYPDRNGWDFENNAPDMYVFVPGGDHEQLRKDFTSLTGPSEMLPLSAFGSWDSRWYAYSEETALKQIDDFREKGFPLDNLVIDTDWRVNASTGYAINTALFPDMERFFQRAHEKNVSIMFNDHPEPQGTGDGLSAVEVAYRNLNLRSLLDMGLDIWWYDRNWSVALRSPASGIPKETWGMYLYTWITGDNNKVNRPLIMGNIDGIDNGAFNRAPNLASHRFQIQWTGDIGPSTASLKAEVRNAVRGGAISSLPYVSADIGGHTSDPTRGMYARWTQFGTFSPIYRPHGTHNLERMPWSFGAQAEAIAHEYVDMRYRLLPLYYALSHDNYETGMPLLRRLDFNYPQYVEASADDQYTLGDNILIAPIVDAPDSNVINVPSDWLKTPTGEPGLQGEYYNNNSLTGSPVLTRVDAKLDFNWGTGSPHSSVPSDNFSARWTGTVTMGQDAYLQLIADDGVRLWVDDELVIDSWVASDSGVRYGDQIYAAGSTHSIKIEYYEGSGNANMRLNYLPVMDTENTRTVFIPDGRWIDVWTGEAYEGPRTIEVSHPLETSPMFVRGGTILPLAENMMYTGEKTWENIALDVYPSTQLKGIATLYEDDTKTVAYKEGAFRTTALETSYDKATGKFSVQIDPAQGSFEGPLAFQNRNWKIRVHAPQGWGEMTSASLDGNTVTPVLIEKSADGTPFANQGAALDGDVYEVSLSGNISQKHVLTFGFASPQDEEIPEIVEVPVTRTVKELFPEKSVNLTEMGTYDWAHFGGLVPTTIIKKANVEQRLISDLASSEVPYEFHDNYVAFNWTDGDGLLPMSVNNILGPVSNSNFTLTAKAGPQERSLTLYMGGWKSMASLKVRDNTSGKVDVLNFGNLDSNYYRKVVINYSAEQEGDLYIQYVKTDGTGNITFSAAAVADPINLSQYDPIQREISLDDVSDTIDLTAEGTRDWIHMGYGNASSVNRKKDVQSFLNPPVPISGSFSRSNDWGYTTTPIVWSDGAPTASSTGTRDCVFSSSTGMTFDVPADRQLRELKVYVGAWYTTNQITISDDSGNIPQVYTIESPSSAGGSAKVKVLTIRYKAPEDGQTLHIEFKRITSTGNISFAAATVRDIDETITVNANEPFTFQVRTPLTAKNIKLFNEVNRGIGLRVLTKTVEGDQVVWDVTTALGTGGDNRQLNIFYVDQSGELVDSGQRYQVNVIPAVPEVKSAVFSLDRVERNAPVEMTVITSNTVKKVELFNETGMKMGKLQLSKTNNADGDIVWVYQIAMGTRRTGAVITATGYDAAGTKIEPGASATIDII